VDLDQKKRLLTVLVILFLIVLGYQGMNPYEQGRVEQLTYTGEGNRAGKTDRTGSKRAGGDNNQVPGVRVYLHLLTDPSDHRGEVLNQHFFQPIPAVKPEPSAPPPSPAPSAGENTAGPAAEDPLSMVEQDLSRLQVIGLFTRGDEPVIFFQRGKQTLVVREGDRIDGKYLVEEITLDAITLRAEHLNDTVHIDLTRFLKSYERDRLNAK
jgi:hypothetical protein